MASPKGQVEPIEQGDIYFFYRPKVDIDKPRNLDGVQRFHVVMVPDGKAKSRLFVVGKKRMPDIARKKIAPKKTVPEKSSSSQREWMMTYLATTPKKIGDALRPLTYATKTRGTREQGEAIPVGEGRYVLALREDSTRLAYRLVNPSKPGKAQQEFGIRQEASYLISVRNPDVDVPGFPEQKPDYPKKLSEKFADERWIDIDDPKLLEYESAQLVLIGAHKSLEEADISISGKPDLFGKLELDKSEWPTQALTGGSFAGAEYAAEPEVPKGDRSKGGRRGGRAAAHAPSAAGVAKALKGVRFPSDRGDLVNYARDHDADHEVVDLLKELPTRHFKTMADVQSALSEVR